MSSFGVVPDACVLIPASVRDILLRTASAGMYRVYWSEDILNEVRKNLVQTGLVRTMTLARKVTNAMDGAFPEALLDGHHALIPSMPNDPKDRHVVALAVVAHAEVIVTSNLRHFPSASLRPLGIEPQSPDVFLEHLFDLNPEMVVRLLHEQCHCLTKPPLDLDSFLGHLGKNGAPVFVKRVRDYMSTKMVLELSDIGGRPVRMVSRDRSIIRDG